MKRLRPDFQTYKHVSYLVSMRRANGTICIVAIVIILSVGFFVNINIKRGVNNEKYSEMLDGCYHIYLDVGYNIGIQVRKLFEPERYTEGKVLPFFNNVFGNIDYRRKENHANGKRIWVVGFEPNPRHKRGLIKLLRRRETFVILNKSCVLFLQIFLNNSLKLGICYNLYIIYDYVLQITIYNYISYIIICNYIYYIYISNYIMDIYIYISPEPRLCPAFFHI